MIGALRVGAVVLAGALAAYPVAVVDASAFPAALAVAGAGLVTAGVVARREPPTWGGALLLGSGYVAAVAVRGGDVDPGAPAVAVGLFLVVEAAEVARSGGTGAAARLWYSLAVCFGAALVTGALLMAGTAVRTAGPLAVAASALCGAVLLSGLAAFAGTRSGDDA